MLKMQLGSRQLNKVLIWFVLLGLLATLPLTYGRWVTEQSAKQVEVVFDYSDLLVIASYQPNPKAFITEQLEQLKAIGIQSLAVYEATLNELNWSGRLQLYTAKEARLLKREAYKGQNYTYVLFSDQQFESVLGSIIEKAFTDRDVAVKPWEYGGKSGLEIQLGMEEATIVPMEPDPLTLQDITEAGFIPVVRLSNNRAFDAMEMDDLLARLKSYGVRWIVFSGDEVTGYEEGKLQNVNMMAELLNKHDIGFAAIEMLRTPQKGMNRLAYLTNYDTIRLHSLPELNSGDSPQVISDRLQLAVKDRDIRMLYLNAEMRKQTEKAIYKHTLANLYEGLKGENGALSRIQKAGYTLGEAEPFAVKEIAGERIFKAIALLGAVAFITLLAAQFVPSLTILIFIIGLIGSGGLYVLSSSLLSQALALGTAISAPTLAVIWAIRHMKRYRDRDPRGKFSLIKAIATFVAASCISLSGAFFIIGLLNNVTYMLVLEQFRGVSLLHLAPIALVAVYVYFFSEQLTPQALYERTKQLLLTNVKVLWVILAGMAGVVVLYYLSRTGNEGQVSSVEMNFRAFLENTLGVRPRTKEFLLAHPLMVCAIYFAAKYKHVMALSVVGVIGQLSMVDTFAHIHSPLSISFIRGVYGMVIGIVVGVVLIVMINALIRGWKRWQPRLSD